MPLKCAWMLTLWVALLVAAMQPVATQHTALDDIFGNTLRQVKQLLLPLLGRTSENPELLQRVRSNGKTQQASKQLSSLQSLCPEGVQQKRSAQPPQSVHRLRPGDIDIVGAMGDSLTAGNAIFSSRLRQTVVENRGRSAFGGGQGTWRNQLTIPNILKEFNPKLYGYGQRDGWSIYRSSKFNVGESGAMSRDMPYMARVLAKRMRRDPRVNMTGDWKLVTYFIGANDFCADMCYYENPEIVLQWHERDLVESLRYLRDHVPRLMVNLIKPPNVLIYVDLHGLPATCRLSRPFACPCLIGYGKTKSQLSYYKSIIERWTALDTEIVNREEFNTDTFTVNVLSVFNVEKFPEDSNGNKIVQLLAADCFHLSGYGQAVGCNTIWNNMLGDPVDENLLDPAILGHLRCPTAARPYLSTRVNRRDDFPT